MPQRLPKRPTGTKRPTRISGHASPSSLKLDRSYAQKIRTDRTGMPYESMAKRAQFWAHQQAALAAEQQRIVDESVGQISQGTFKENLTFASANIHSANMNTPPPSMPDTMQSILGPGGIAPPPPPP